MTYVRDMYKDQVYSYDELSDTNSDYEALWLKINMQHCKDIVVCNIYRPPAGNLVKCLEYIENCYSAINTAKTDIFILGDFNVDVKNTKMGDNKKLSFFFKSNQLTQWINENTRNTINTNTVIDLGISNCKYISHSGTIPVFISDHQPIHLIKKKSRDRRPKESFMGRSYRGFDEKRFKQSLRNKNWGEIINTESAELAWDSLFRELQKEFNDMCLIKK